MRSKVGFPYSSAGSDRAVHDQSLAALPYFVTSSARKLESLRDASEGQSQAEPPE
jgi:hypothetical protein